MEQFYDCIKNNLWFPKHVTTKDIMYSIEAEPKVRKVYEAVTGNCVGNRFPYLGASPHGMVKSSTANIIGSIEIKCLNIFKDKLFEDIIHEHNENKNLSSTLYNRQCFKIECGEILL